MSVCDIRRQRQDGASLPYEAPLSLLELHMTTSSVQYEHKFQTLVRRFCLFFLCLVLCVRFRRMVCPAGAVHAVDSDADAAGIEGGFPPLGSDSGIWVTQPLTLTRKSIVQ